MKRLIFILTSIVLLVSFTSQPNYVDPTGSYALVSKTKNKNGDIYGYTGAIQVKKISPNRIVMTFEINRGAPSYNSGSFVDTLLYKNNTAIYRNAEFDSTCKIAFMFNKKGVNVKQEKAENTSGCGFGYGVVAFGFFKRISSKSPVLTRPLTGEKLEE